MIAFRFLLACTFLLFLSCSQENDSGEVTASRSKADNPTVHEQMSTETTPKPPAPKLDNQQVMVVTFKDAMVRGSEVVYAFETAEGEILTVVTKDGEEDPYQLPKALIDDSEEEAPAVVNTRMIGKEFVATVNSAAEVVAIKMKE